MKTRKPAPDQAQLNPITSHLWGHFLNIEALFRCMACSPCLPISISFPLQKGWIWSGPIGVWIMKGLPGAGRGPVIPRTRGLGFWVGFGWVPLLRDACTHVSLWQPLPKSKARHRCCMYYIEIQYRTQLQTFYYSRNAVFHTNGAHAVYISICITLIFC